MAGPSIGDAMGLPLLRFAANATDPAAYLAEALPWARQDVRAEGIALVAVQDGRWSLRATDGEAESLPRDLLSEVLDCEQPQATATWNVVPLMTSEVGQQVLAVRGRAMDAARVLEIAQALSDGLLLVEQRVALRRRIDHVETLLEITRQWNATRETEPLLVQIAEAATRILGADRASIFLWDRAHGTLIGRPALGVEEGALTLPDDRGIVGQVVQTGNALRVDRHEGEPSIDRSVDQQVGYTTENLLCVPLRGMDGEMLGAFEVLNKKESNFSDRDETTLIELAAHAATALENTQEREALLRANRRWSDQAADSIRMIGESRAIESIRETIHRVADTDLAVLILGENGTGKEVASQTIHYRSRRRDLPFLAVNCAALPDTLLESELFGHEKGAFTDAHETRAGKFEAASGGTIFLDEIGDLSLAGQAKMLRVLEGKVIVRVGGTEPIPVDVRVIAATHQNLVEKIREKTFREDLYFRLNVVTLEMPPLRDRAEDILLLAEFFLKEFASKAGSRAPQLMASARKRLMGHSWPGNIRELRNLMERLTYLASSEKLEAKDLEFTISPRASGRTQVEDDLALTEATSHFQQAYIDRAIERSGGNMSLAAKRLGLHRSNLYRKMRQLEMKTDGE